MKPSHQTLSGFRIPRGRLSVAILAAMLALAAFAGSAQACSSAGAEQRLQPLGRPAHLCPRPRRRLRGRRRRAGP